MSARVVNPGVIIGSEAFFLHHLGNSTMLERAQMLKKGKHVLRRKHFKMRIVDASQTTQEEDVESVAGFWGENDDFPPRKKNERRNFEKIRNSCERKKEILS